MSLIQKLVVTTEAQTGKLGKGLNSAAGMVAKFAAGAVGAVTGVGGAIAAVAGSAAIGAVVSMVSSAMDSIDELGSSADKLGVGTEALSALRFAAQQSDVEIETLQNGLQKLNAKLGESSLGSKASAQAFIALGLSAEQLAGMGTTEAFTAIAEKIAGIQNPAQQAAAAMSIFGKSGQELLPLLKQGADGIGALEARAKELGLTLNDADVAKVKAANDAIDELKAAFTGVFNIIAVQVAPIVGEFAKQITNSGYLGQAASEWIVSGMELIVTGIAYAVDAFNIFKGVWYTIKGVAGVVITAISAAFTGLIQATVGGINWLLESIGMSKIEAPFVGVMQDFTRALANETGQAFKDADAAFSAPSTVDKTKKFFADLKKGAGSAAETIENKTVKATEMLADSIVKLGEDIEKLTGDWQTQLDTMGMTSREAELFKLKQAGASKEQLEALEKLNKELTKSEEMQKLKDEGKQLTESLMSPLEKFKAEQEKLQKLLDAGAIDKTTFDRGLAKAYADTESTAGASGPSMKLAGAADKNSVEAFSILANASVQTGSGSTDPLDRLASLADKEFSEAKKQTALLRQLAGNSATATEETIF